MNADTETIAVYDAQAAEYARLTESEAHDRQLLAFIAAMPAGGLVLDLGCGPGHAAAAMAKAGLQVEATDASGEMVALASRHRGVRARQALFEDIDAQDRYDGIWANFSLLHAPRAAMPGNLARLARALKPGGQFHIGLKSGTGERRDGLGRLYTYFAEAEIAGLLQAAGFTIDQTLTGRSLGLDGELADWIVIEAHG
jgi:SAM-dependent methyltransferase